MNLQDLSIEQLQEIVDGAPNGAEYYAPRSKRYYAADFGGSQYLKLSDIRAELKARDVAVCSGAVCIEEETPELFESKHCSPRNYNNAADDERRLKELDASVDHAKAALATFNYKPIPTDRELQQAEQIRILKTDRNVWCAMFFIAVVGYGVARWML